MFKMKDGLPPCVKPTIDGELLSIVERREKVIVRGIKETFELLSQKL